MPKLLLFWAERCAGTGLADLSARFLCQLLRVSLGSVFSHQLSADSWLSPLRTPPCPSPPILGQICLSVTVATGRHVSVLCLPQEPLHLFPHCDR